jgi:extracellular elastinolytic metalloproteinase
VVAQLDGFLTAPADGDARDIVLDYVRSRPALFKLDSDDLTRLRLVRDETDPFGVRHLLWAQQAGGIPAFDNDLRASVTNDGRILTVMGSPLPDLAGRGNDVIYSRDGVRETVVKGGPGTDKARRDNADKTTSVERRF